MIINKRNWFTFILFSILSLAVWYKFSYPQFAFTDLSISRKQALEIAKNYLLEKNKNDIESYSHAVIFSGVSAPDQYLQKAMGHQAEIEFAKKHDLDLFAWKVRFFKENEKEQFHVSVSADKGEVVGLKHTLKANEARPEQDEETAKAKVISFLKKQCGFKPEQYVINYNHSKKYENRVDYTFAWEKKDVLVSWSEEPETGNAKVLIGAKIAGDDITYFYKSRLKIPDEFNRYLSRQQSVGRNLSVLFRIVYYAFLTIAVFYVVVRRNNLILHTTRNFAISLTGMLFLFHLSIHFNNYENILYNYPTHISFTSYIWQHTTESLLGMFIVTISILMPLLAGESLHYEAFQGKKEGSFLYYIQSSFLSRDVFKLVILGYFTTLIMIGIQSGIFEIGQKYLGVWIEYIWMAQLSTGYLPFLTAFVIGFSASFTEEIGFRLFSVSLGKKCLKKTFIAVLLASIFWGYGHSSYPIYPMWFRGLEVTLLGIFISYVYLRFGIIPVIVAHFLFDVLWSSSAYILGKSTPYHFFSSLAIVLLPFLLGCIAYWVNCKKEMRPLRWNLNKHQIFNLKILRNYIENNIDLEKCSKQDIVKEITGHGWDIAVVEIALKEMGID